MTSRPPATLTYYIPGIYWSGTVTDDERTAITRLATLLDEQAKQFDRLDRRLDEGLCNLISEVKRLQSETAAGLSDVHDRITRQRSECGSEFNDLRDRTSSAHGYMRGGADARLTAREWAAVCIGALLALAGVVIALVK